MLDWWPHIQEKIRSRIPDRRVLLVPADCFFTKAFELPANVSGADIDSFAQLSIEGASSAKWVVMDFGGVIVHIFQKDIREHYALERLWGDAGQVKLPEDRAVKALAPARTTARPARTRKRV